MCKHSFILGYAWHGFILKCVTSNESFLDKLVDIGSLCYASRQFLEDVSINISMC